MVYEFNFLSLISFTLERTASFKFMILSGDVIQTIYLCPCTLNKGPSRHEIFYKRQLNNVLISMNISSSLAFKGILLFKALIAFNWCGFIHGNVFEPNYLILNTF